jgi:hypothetical protein
MEPWHAPTCLTMEAIFKKSSAIACMYKVKIVHNIFSFDLSP